MITSFWNFLLRLFFRTNWRFPEFVVRPARLLHEGGLVLSSAFLGRPGAGKTFALAQELLEQMKAHPEQSFFIFDWSGRVINTLFQLIISDPQRDEIERRLVFDAMGGRTIKGHEYVMPMPEFSEEYDPEKQWLERVEDQGDCVRRVLRQKIC